MLAVLFDPPMILERLGLFLMLLQLLLSLPIIKSHSEYSLIGQVKTPRRHSVTTAILTVPIVRAIKVCPHSLIL
jgi:hypothetical protein